MNRIFRTVFNRALNTLQVASEIARGDTSGSANTGELNTSELNTPKALGGMKKFSLKAMATPIASALLLTTLVMSGGVGGAEVISVSGEVTKSDSVITNERLEIDFGSQGGTLIFQNSGNANDPFITLNNVIDGILISGSHDNKNLVFRDVTVLGNGTGIYHTNAGNVSLNLSALKSLEMSRLKGYNGVGIYMNSTSGNADLVLGNKITFRENGVYSPAQGGIIFVRSLAAGTSAKVTLGENVYFDSNSSSQNGIIYLNATNTELKITSNTFFFFFATTSVIRMINGAGGIGTLILNASSGDIVFDNSFVNESIEQQYYDISIETGSANITVSGDNNVFIDGLIKANALSGNSFVKKGSGILQLGTGGILFPDHKNDFVLASGDPLTVGSFSVQDNGTFRLATNEGVRSILDLGTGTNGGTFTIEQDATLSGEGDIKGGTALSVVINGTVAPDSAHFSHTNYNENTNTFIGAADTTIHFGELKDEDKPSLGRHPDQRFGTYNITGNTTFNGAKFILDISDSRGVSGKGATDLINVLEGATLTVNGTNTVTQAVVDVFMDTSYAFITKASGTISGSGTFKFNDILNAGKDLGDITLSGYINMYSLAARKDLSKLGINVGKTTNNQSVAITFSGELGRLDLIWTDEAGDHKWGTTTGNVVATDNVTSENWTESDTKPFGVEKRFMNGDRVTFGDIPFNDANASNGTGTASLDAGGTFYVERVDITGNVMPGYVEFTNTGSAVYQINGVIGDYYNADAIGNKHTQVVSSGEGGVRLNGANTYEGGTIIKGGGTVSVTKDKSLSTWATAGANPALATAGLVTVTGTGGELRLSSTVVQEGEEGADNTSGLVKLQNHFEVKDGSTLTIYTGADTGVEENNIKRVLAFANVKNTGAGGGAINVVNSDLIMNGYSRIVLEGNSAEQNGGAIAITSNTTRNYDWSGLYGTLDMGKTDNPYRASAGSRAKDSGGAIYLFGTNDAALLTLTLPTNTHFQDNTAGNVGGAIATNGTLNINGATYFQGNSATNGGGAIALLNGGKLNIHSGASLTDANGEVVFSGNKWGSDANSLLLKGNNTITITGYRNVYFDDPINATGDNNHLTIQTTRTDNVTAGLVGFVKFYGDNFLNPSTATQGSVTINSGMMRLATTHEGGVTQNSLLTVGGTGTTFTINQNGWFTGGGVINAGKFHIHGSIAPDSGVFVAPVFGYSNNTFIYRATVIDTEHNRGELHLEGNATFYGEQAYAGGENPYQGPRIYVDTDAYINSEDKEILSSDKIFANHFNYVVDGTKKIFIQLAQTYVGTFDILIGEGSHGDGAPGHDEEYYFTLLNTGGVLFPDNVLRKEEAKLVFRDKNDPDNEYDVPTVALSYMQGPSKVISWRGIETGIDGWKPTEDNWQTWVNSDGTNVTTRPPTNDDPTNFVIRDFVFLDKKGLGNEDHYDFMFAEEAPQISGLLVEEGTWSISGDPKYAASLDFVPAWHQYDTNTANNTSADGLNLNSKVGPIIDDVYYQLAQITVKKDASLTLAMGTTAQGVVLEGGNITVAHSLALGVWADNAADKRLAGMLIARGSEVDEKFEDLVESKVYITDDLILQSRFMVGEVVDGTTAPDGQLNRGDERYWGKLTINIAPKKTLILNNVNTFGTEDIFLENGGVINVVTPGSEDGKKSALTFTGGGNLVFRNNSANYGGAVGTYFGDKDQNAVLDFTGLNSIFLEGHTARDEGGAVYAGAQNEMNDSATNQSGRAYVVFGDNVTLTGNTAGKIREGGKLGDALETVDYGGSGGAVNVYSEHKTAILVMGHNLTVSDNAAYGVSDVEYEGGYAASGGAIIAVSDWNGAKVELGNSTKPIGTQAEAGNGAADFYGMMNFIGNIASHESGKFTIPEEAEYIQDFPYFESNGGAIAALANFGALDNDQERADAIVWIAEGAQVKTGTTNRIGFESNQAGSDFTKSAGNGGAIAAVVGLTDNDLALKKNAEGKAEVLVGNNMNIAEEASLSIVFAPDQTSYTDGNTAHFGNGGAIYASAQKGDAIVKIGTEKEGNGALIIRFGNSAKGNKAGNSGGAIYAASVKGAATVEIGANATITNNVAIGLDANNKPFVDGGNGGAIYAASAEGIATVEIGANAAITKNEAIGLDADNKPFVSGGNGGAIVADVVILHGNTQVTDNKALNGLGGAIYLTAGKETKLTLNADVGNITFTGNTDKNGANAVKANDTLITALGDYNITFNDALVSNNSASAKNKLVQEMGNNAILLFARDTTLYGAGLDANTYGAEINSGIFRAVAGKTLTLEGAAKGLILGGDFETVNGKIGTIAGGSVNGTVSNIKAAQFELSGKLAPDAGAVTLPVTPSIGTLRLEVTTGTDKKATFSGAQLALDLASTLANETVDFGGVIGEKALLISDRVEITGGLVEQGSKLNTIDLQSWNIGTYRVLRATGNNFGDSLASNGEIKFDEENVTLLGNKSPHGITNSNGDPVQREWGVDITKFGDSVYLTTWQSANRAIFWRDHEDESHDSFGRWGSFDAQDWNMLPQIEHWPDKNTNFLPGDKIVFDDIGADLNRLGDLKPSETIVVTGGGVLVSEMNVTHANYAFNGETDNTVIYGKTTWTNCEDDNDLSTCVTGNGGSGLLRVFGHKETNLTTLTLNLATDFENGVELAGGTVVIGHNAALGTWQEATALAPNAKRGWVTIAAVEDPDLSDGIDESGDGFVTIKIHGNAETRAMSNHFEIGALGNENVAAQLTLDIESNATSSATLKLFNAGQHSTDVPLTSGGAINVLSAGDNGLQFTGGGNIEIVNNKAQMGGGIAIVRENTSSSNAILLLPGEDHSDAGLGLITFEANEAATDNGGAVMLKSEKEASLIMRSRVYFEGNKANGSGGAVSIEGAEKATLSVEGNTYFHNNTSNVAGGAVYLNGGQTDVKLDASSGIIAFENNTRVINGAIEGNALYTEGNTALSLTGSHNIYFDDPIIGNHEGNILTVDLGAGLVQFVGASEWKVASSANAVNVNSGIFRLATVGGNSASFNAEGGIFTMAAGTTLAGGGTLAANTFNLDGRISPDSDHLAVPHYNTTIHQFADPVTVVNPDNALGELIFGGDLTLGDHVIYEVDLDSDGRSDLLTITGNLNVSPGAEIEVNYSLEDVTHDPTGEWTIIQTLNVDDDKRFDEDDAKFGATDESSTLFLDAKVKHDLSGDSSSFDKIKIVISRNDKEVSDYAETPNQQETAKGLEDAHRNSDNPDGSPIYNEVISPNPNIRNSGDLRELLDQLSGEIHASVKTAIINNSRLWTGQLNKHAHTDYEEAKEIYLAASDKTTETPFARIMKEQGNLWAHVDGAYMDSDLTPDHNAAESKWRGGGLTVGFDRLFGDGNKLGAALRGGRANFDVDDRKSEATIDSYSVGLYGAKTYENYHFIYGASYGRNAIKTTRNVTMLQTPQTLKADYAIDVAQGFAEAGYVFQTQTTQVEPYFGLTWSHVRQENFQEGKESNNAKLHAPKKTDVYPQVSIGARGSFLLGSAIIDADVSWLRQLKTREVSTKLAFDGGKTPFTIWGNPLVEHGLATQIGATFNVWKNGTVKIAYDSVIGYDTRTYGGYITLNHRF